MTAWPDRARAIAWLANLDADDELAAPRGYTPRPALLAAATARLPALAALFRPGDVVLVEGDVLPAEGALGAGVTAVRVRGARLDPDRFAARAWCPTPRAARVIKGAGLALAGPPLAVLRAVNGRRFAARFGQPLPGAQLVSTFADLERLVAAPPAGRAWLCKREHGFAGRGRRLIDAGAIDDAARAWARASLREGGCLQVEPLVARTADFGLHGFVAEDGVVTTGELTAQRCDDRGAWLGSRRADAGEVLGEELAELRRATDEAATALSTAGYAGPFGVDAYAWVDGAGLRRMNPRCEINARYSMGWAVGLGEARPDRAI